MKDNIEKIQFLYRFLVFVLKEIVRNNKKVFALRCCALSLFFFLGQLYCLQVSFLPTHSISPSSCGENSHSVRQEHFNSAKCDTKLKDIFK